MCYFIYKGWKRGIVREVATLVGVLAGIWAAVHLSQQVAELIGLESENAVLVAFFICFVGALVLAWLLGRLIENLMKSANLSIVNRLGGATSGMVKALCILAVMLNYVVMFDRHEVVLKPETKEKSVLYKPVYNTGNKLTESLKQFIAEHEEDWDKKIKESK
jgi:membrane protein required for colicin V production